MKNAGTGASLRKLPRYKTDWRKICAMLPVYLEDGTNGTVITYLDGTEDAVPNRLCWVLDDLLQYLRSSRAVLAAQSRSVLGKKARRVPLMLSREFCLVPVKGREAIGAYDGMVGYILLQHVQNMVQQKGSTVVQFGDHAAVQVYDQYRTVQANLRRANAVYHYFSA